MKIKLYLRVVSFSSGFPEHDGARAVRQAAAEGLEMDGEKRGDRLKVQRRVSYFERRCSSLYG